MESIQNINLLLRKMFLYWNVTNLLVVSGASGPDLLAEEVEDVQTESDADEESEDEASTKPVSGGPKSTEIEVI